MDISGQQSVVVFGSLGVGHIAEHFRLPERWFLTMGLGSLDQRVNQSACAPACESEKSRFLRPIANGRMAFSHGLLSIGIRTIACIGSDLVRNQA